MPNWARTYVRIVEAMNYRVGRIAMYLLFVMMGIMLWSSMTKVLHIPSLWTLEMAQFVFVGYYLLGGPYSMQLGSNVRMDLIYGKMSPRRQAAWDSFTVFALIFYLCVMIYGAIDATVYSIQTGQRNPTAWRPVLWPLNLVICAALILMLLQSIAHLIRDIAVLRGVDLGPEPAAAEKTDAEVL